MFPTKVLDALEALDSAISEAEKNNAPGAGGDPTGGIPDGSVIITNDDVDNLAADLTAKTDRVRAIGKAPAAPVAGTTSTAP